jgi:integrase/recombinase XerD
MKTEIVSANQIAVIAQQASSDDHLIDLFIRLKRSRNTQRTYRLAVRQFLEFVGNKPLQTINLDDMVRYTEHLETTYQSKYTQRLKLDAVRSLLTFGQKVGYLQFNVGTAVEAPKPENSLAERIVSEEQVLMVINAPNRQRDRILLRLLYSTGMRVSEVCRLQWRHINSSKGNGVLTVYGKGDKTRFVAISPAMYGQLMSIKPAVAAPSDYVFTSQRSIRMDASTVFRVVKRAGKAVGIPGLSPHWLRHAHASHALDRGAKVATVKETLGHSNIAITNNYVHIRPDDSSALYLVV